LVTRRHQHAEIDRQHAGAEKRQEPHRDEHEREALFAAREVPEPVVASHDSSNRPIAECYWPPLSLLFLSISAWYAACAAFSRAAASAIALSCFFWSSSRFFSSSAFFFATSCSRRPRSAASFCSRAFSSACFLSASALSAAAFLSAAAC